MRLLLSLLVIACGTMWAGDAPAGYRKVSDIPFAEVDGHRLALDLYLPEGKPGAPLVVFVHGGGWQRGSRTEMPLGGMAPAGFAFASVDYRLSPVARFPAQAHDLKAAIRFLRAKQGEYGYNASRIAIAGTSAGAHLAALVGVTNGNKELEGTVGGNLDQSSDVQAILSYYGASDFMTILPQSTPFGLGVRVPALQILLGGQPQEKEELAKLASPVYHLDANDPPLLLLHGDQDPQMPINQSAELYGAYREKGLDAEFLPVYQAAHGGKKFHEGAQLKAATAFLTKNLHP
ncbi:MAG: alpha/beta hydrolase [Acidobacteria bacterium]|nr:alpha/beta hydrolase [Acidobacteriota bacterium]